MQNMHNMHNMQLENMQNTACLSWALVLLQHRNKRTLVLLHSCVGLCMNFKQQQQLAELEPNVIHPGLKGDIRNSRRSDKHDILTICLLHFFLVQTAMRISAFYPDVLYAQSREWKPSKYDPGCCWMREDAECPAVPYSVQHTLINCAKYAKYVCRYTLFHICKICIICITCTYSVF